LHYESPFNLFKTKSKSFHERFKICYCCCVSKKKKEEDAIEPIEAISNQIEQHEMQFNYIFLDLIQGENKINLMKSLSDSEDLCLFEQEPIQMIIDYKWHTYAEAFFRRKFFIYICFLLTFYIDLESMHFVDEEGKRIKD
jgi:hypothetical protein